MFYKKQNNIKPIKVDGPFTMYDYLVSNTVPDYYEVRVIFKGREYPKPYHCQRKDPEFDDDDYESYNESLDEITVTYYFPYEKISIFNVGKMYAQYFARKLRRQINPLNLEPLVYTNTYNKRHVCRQTDRPCEFANTHFNCSNPCQISDCPIWQKYITQLKSRQKTE